MYHPYYVPLFGPNMNFPYEYKVPSSQYQTSPWYIASTYDINRVPTGPVLSSYTYGKGRAKGIPRFDWGLNVYPSVSDSVTYYQDTKEKGNNNVTSL